MYFEAEFKNKKFKVHVREMDTYWHINIEEEGKKEVLYKIEKTSFREESDGVISFLFKGKSHLIDVINEGDTQYNVFTRGSFRNIKIFNDEMLLKQSLKKEGFLSKEKTLKSGMPGKIIEVFVKEGDEVEENQALIIMEAMKMENEIRSPIRTKIKKIFVQQGQNVEADEILLEFENIT